MCPVFRCHRDARCPYRAGPYLALTTDESAPGRNLITWLSADLDEGATIGGAA